jgi:hypothetical protein
MRRGSLTKVISGALLAAFTSMGSNTCFAGDEATAGPQKPASPGSGLYIKVQLDNGLKLSKLKPGDVVEGKLARDVYSSDREVFTAGSHMRLPVDHLEKRKRIPNDHWPGVVKLFTPRHENYPVFKTATIPAANGESSLQVSLISISRMREVHAQAKKKGSGPQAGNVEVSPPNAAKEQQKTIAPTMILEASIVEDMGSPSASSSSGAESGASSRPEMPVDETLPAGTVCKILLLGDVSASKSMPGDAVQARLIEPVLLNSRLVLPAGTVVEGKVVKKTPPRWGSRAGSLALTFSSLTPPGGNVMPIAASLSEAELDRRSHTKIDSEGQLRGEHPGKAWMAINLGVTAGIAKEADDTFQLIFEAIVSTATDASTAGTARIVASSASAIYLVTRKGRDVVVPRFTEMEISLDRPLSVTRRVAEGAVTGEHGN